MRVLSSIVLLIGAVTTALALKEPPTELQVGTVHAIVLLFFVDNWN